MLNSQLKSFQERMKRVEESLLSTDYKKHIQVRGRVSGRGLASGVLVQSQGCFCDGPREQRGLEPGGYRTAEVGSKALFLGGARAVGVP